MKIYTEEELRKHLYNHDERFFEELTPIELPSDEEMANASNHCKDNQMEVGFLRGVLWMKEQILNQKTNNL